MSQGRTQIIALKGYSNSGKTSALESIIEYLKKNQKNTAVVKHIHRENFTIDQPGKDTWRLRKAGGEPIVSYSDDEIAIITNQKLSIEKTLEIIKQLQPDVNFVFLEGFWQNLYPKILFLRNVNDLKEMIAEFSKNTDFDEIIESIFCISGIYLTQNSLSRESFLVMLNRLYNQTIITESQKEFLRSIPFLDIMNHPEKLLGLYKDLKFNFRK
jgi:molybdopterin-guanine dinucleotide biosynthesis protein B